MDAVSRARAYAAADMANFRRLGAQAQNDSAAADKALREGAALFAGFFLGQVFKIMRQSVRETAFGHGGAGERLFRQMADEEIGMAAARQNAGGLSDLVYRSLTRQVRIAKQEAKT